MQTLQPAERTSPTHRPIMVAEVLRCLRPVVGDVVADCTLGGGGHARALLERIQPAGHLIGIDADPTELARTESQLRADGFGADVLSVRCAPFAELPAAVASAGFPRANIIIADLGVSAMQLDTAERGFSYKVPGPLDMRMNASRGEPAWQLIAQLSEAELASLLVENADEPRAALIAQLLKQRPVTTTHAAERLVRTGLNAAMPRLPKRDVKMSVRRAFQALRIAVNNEFAELDALLHCLPNCLAPGGRVAMLTFHSGEDRRVKKAFQAGFRAGIYSSIARRVVRSAKEETFSNRRAAAAKLRWAVRN